MQIDNNRRKKTHTSIFALWIRWNKTIALVIDSIISWIMGLKKKKKQMFSNWNWKANELLENISLFFRFRLALSALPSVLNFINKIARHFLALTAVWIEWIIENDWHVSLQAFSISFIWSSVFGFASHPLCVCFFFLVFSFSMQIHTEEYSKSMHAKSSLIYHRLGFLLPPLCNRYHSHALVNISFFLPFTAFSLHPIQ